MIVNWTKDNIKGIPLFDEGRNVILAPGYNDVDDIEWSKVRTHVLDQIEAKIIDEEFVRVKRDEATKSKLVYSLEMKQITDLEKLPATTEVYIPATIRDFNKTKAMKVVFNTFHKPTLQKWNEIETRDEVTKALNYEAMFVDNPARAKELYGENYGKI